MEPVNILVIDDEQIMREGCSRILSKDGWAVITCENGKQGLEELQARPEKIDAVLLDLMMPGMSGMEVLDQVRTIDPNLLVIVITGYATVESAVEAMKKGAYDFIPKPFTPDQLRIVVRRALERRTLQKEAEFLRREREKSLRDIATEKSKIKTIINCMGDGVLVCDRDRCVVLSNPAASRMLKISETSLLGNFLSQCGLHPDLSRTIDESLQAKEAGYTSVSQELSIGEEIYLRAHTAPVKNDLGEIMGSVTVLQDISHLKELDKMKSEFIAMVAHELRAPIATVEQQLSVILNKMAGELTEKQEELLARAKERTKGVLTLIKDLLDLSKIEAGKMVQYKEPLTLHEVIQRVVDVMKAEADVEEDRPPILPPASDILDPGGPKQHGGDLHQPGLQRHQIHTGARQGSGHPQRGKWICEGHCFGYGNRYKERGPPKDLRSILPGEVRGDTPDHRNRAWAVHRQKHCGCPSGVHLGGERGGKRDHVHAPFPERVTSNDL